MITIKALIYCVIATSCLAAEPIGSFPDESLQKVMGKAGAALVAFWKDNTNNVLRKLTVDEVPMAMQVLEKMTEGERIKLAQQFAYFMRAARTNETCEIQSKALFLYLAFTPDEMDKAKEDMERLRMQEIARQLSWLTQQQRLVQTGVVQVADIQLFDNIDADEARQIATEYLNAYLKDKRYIGDNGKTLRYSQFHADNTWQDVILNKNGWLLVCEPPSGFYVHVEMDQQGKKVRITKIGFANQ